MKSLEKKRKKEQRIVDEMIRLYCRKKHGQQEGGLCPECRRLAEYARVRSEKCPFMEKKTFCSNCRVHCYKPEMREEIRRVMRYAGPRMLLRHPALALWHVLTSAAEKRKRKEEKQ